MRSLFTTINITTIVTAASGKRKILSRRPALRNHLSSLSYYKCLVLVVNETTKWTEIMRIVAKPYHFFLEDLGVNGSIKTRYKSTKITLLKKMHM